jgi:hypothetical protein
MNTTIQYLQESLSKAIDMIDESKLIDENINNRTSIKLSANVLDFTNANSLIEKCEAVTSNYKKNKPIIRVLHHLACSGGTLISKCISAQPNVFLLSEIHPSSILHLGSQKALFAPTDIIMQAHFGRFPKQISLQKKIFLASLEVTEKHVSSHGGNLIVREHTHSDYTSRSKIVENPIVRELLEEKYKVLSLLTLRNPIDSYMSLLNNGWVQFVPRTFDEYCLRFLKMISHYNTAKVVKYEDFVDSPEEVMKAICHYFDLDFTPDFKGIFDIHNITGDSGRKSGIIRKLERRKIPQELREEIEASKNFSIIKNNLGYQL